MVQAFIVNLVIKQLLKTFNLNKIKDYVEEDNELDKKSREFEKRLINLEKDAHPKIPNLEERLRKKNIRARPVANVHDEFQYEVIESQAEDFGKLAVDSIINAGKELGIRCPLNGEYKYGNNWEQTH